MVSDWAFLGIFLAISFFFPVVPILAGMALGPHKRGSEKNRTYECGMETRGDSQLQFRASYYIFALVFLVFDVEVVFLFPWAAAYLSMPLFAALEGAFFLLLLGAGLMYLWRKGALEWI
jgi:NADH-quinone oxidoreductase subunit A